MDSSPSFNLVGIFLIVSAVIQIAVFHLFVKQRFKNPVQESTVMYGFYAGALISAGLGAAFILKFLPLR